MKNGKTLIIALLVIIALNVTLSIMAHSLCDTCTSAAAVHMLSRSFCSDVHADGDKCIKCDGSKKCHVCSGTGKNCSNNDCSMCSGSGKCYYCNGTGKS